MDALVGNGDTPIIVESQRKAASGPAGYQPLPVLRLAFTPVPLTAAQSLIMDRQIVRSKVDKTGIPGG
jgi:hypothetical protein